MIKFIFTSITAIIFFITLWMIFWWMPIDISQGPVAKTVFIHVPLAWCSMLAIIAVAISSIIYLLRKNLFWDEVAQATAEIGLIFGIVALVSGIIWAKPIWGVWWTGEAKLTTTLILILIYIAYILFRSLYKNSLQMKKIAAIIAVIGAIDSPIIYFAANLWQEAHPVTVIGPLADEESSFGADYGITLLISVIAFTFLFLLLTNIRYKTIKIENNLKENLS
ncbi:MAG: cytochrome C assembly protein [Chloroflexi bacterium]|nr:cytochrome C assembly protein [Chloroflexota bacterium]MBK89554.1 cytochrome C assembly protein [Chloroflexota bacterium]